LPVKKPNDRGVSKTVFWLAGGALSLLVLSLVAVLVQDKLERNGFEAADRAFASRKADQMYNELQLAVNHDLDQGVSVLARHMFGGGASPVLTANKAVADPGDPRSGNLRVEGRWRYLRRFTFSDVGGQPLAQNVVIQVWRSAPGPDPLAPGVLLATRSGTMVPQPGSPAAPPSANLPRGRWPSVIPGSPPTTPPSPRPFPRGGRPPIPPRSPRTLPSGPSPTNGEPPGPAASYSEIKGLFVLGLSKGPYRRLAPPFFPRTLRRNPGGTAGGAGNRPESPSPDQWVRRSIPQGAQHHFPHENILLPRQLEREFRLAGISPLPGVFPSLYHIFHQGLGVGVGVGAAAFGAGSFFPFLFL
jgi:hypothetical protein